MRTELLVVVLLATVLAPAPLEARCRPALGYRLEPLSASPVAPGGEVLLTLVPVYAAGQIVTTTPATLTLRREHCPHGSCTTRAPLRTVAANLFALAIPRTLAADRYAIEQIHAHVTVGPSAPQPHVAVAPVLAAVPMGTQRTGSVSLAATVELAGPPPAGTVGLIARWGTSSWFMPIGAGTTRGTLSRPRCAPAVPGAAPVAIGDHVEVAFVDASGAASPSTSFVATEATY